MRPIIALFITVFVLSGCRTDDAARIYANPDRVWLLKELGGAPFPATATLTFPKEGEIAGEGPCNRYFGALTAAYPAFATGPVGSTRMACPNLRAETVFFTALESATQAEVSDDTLVLSGPRGLRLVFRPPA